LKEEETVLVDGGKMFISDSWKFDWVVVRPKGISLPK
jgi:hypothetical protein